jgi:hypothetical protein
VRFGRGRKNYGRQRCFRGNRERRFLTNARIGKRLARRVAAKAQGCPALNPKSVKIAKKGFSRLGQNKTVMPLVLPKAPKRNENTPHNKGGRRAFCF